MSPFSVGSQTVTLTGTAGSFPVLRLKTREEEQKNVKSLLLKLLENAKEAVTRLPSIHQKEALQAIDEWEKIFFENCQIDSPVDDERLKAARDICLLCFNVEYIMENMAGSCEEKIGWLKIRQGLLSLLPQTLPPHQETIKFVKECYHDFARQVKEEAAQPKISKEQFREMVLKIRAYFEQKKIELIEFVEKIDEQFVHDFEELIKPELLAIEEDKESSILEIYNRVDQLNKKVSQLFECYKKPFEEIKIIEGRMQQLEITQERNLNKADELLKKI